MRMLMKITMDTQAGNAAIKAGNLESIIGGAFEKMQPEAAYFTADAGKRTAYVFFDLKSVDDIPSIAEPFFMGVDAAIEFTPVMALDDLKSGLQKAAASRGTRA